MTGIPDDIRSDGTIFRYDDDGTLDEVVARNVTGVHFEAMGDSAWWMCGPRGMHGSSHDR
jgi:hypothetical protein